MVPALSFLGRQALVGALLVGSVALGGCGSTDCSALQTLLASSGLTYRDACNQASFSLLPRALVDGEWRGGGADGACAVQGRVLRCPAGDAGSVEVEVGPGAATGEEHPLATLRFTAARPVTLGGLGLEGTARFPGATTWLSNGFQSWSQSGVVALQAGPSPAELQRALTAQGDVEVVRSGNELSWWYSYLGGGSVAAFAGAVGATRFKPWLLFHRTGTGSIGVRFVNGAAGEAVPMAAAETVVADPWWIDLGKPLWSMMDAYAHALPNRARTRPGAPTVGWMSWYELWDDVDEAAVRDNAALAKTILGAAPGAPGTPRVIIDDGWQRAWGDWFPNAKFPSGMDGLAGDLAAAGFDVGIWLAPLLVAADQALVTDQPEWFLVGAEYNHLVNGKMRVLDVTHPGAAAHLRETISRIVDWGYDWLKIDFLFAGTYEVQRYEAMTGLQAYHRALQIIREAAGEGTHLLTVGAPPLPSLPYSDSWRLGADIALEQSGVSWHFIANQVRSLAARWPLCLVTRCDADPPLARELPRNQVEFGAWVVAFAGGDLFLSDDLRALPADRRAWVFVEPLPYSAGPFRPESFFPADPPQTLSSVIQDLVSGKNSHVFPLVWRAPDGRRVGLNAAEEPRTVDGVTIPARAARVLQ